MIDIVEGREEERERNLNVWLPLTHPLLGTWPTTQASSLTENRTRDPLVCRPALNPLSHTSQDGRKTEFELGGFKCRTFGLVTIGLVYEFS